MAGVILFVLTVALPAGSAHAQPSPVEAELVASLRHGGHVLFFRHARTDMSQQDTSLADCRTQRNLSDEGRDQARAIGEAIRKLGIPIGRVLASPFCRTRETAQLAFGRYEVSEALRGRGATEEQRRVAASFLRPLLGAAPEPGTNTVLVSHGFNIHAVNASLVLGEGEAAVFRPGPGGAFELVGRITAERWVAP